MDSKPSTAVSLKALLKELSRFRERTPGSARHFEKAKRRVPYGVHSNYRLVEPYPLYMRRGSGTRLWDVDGNEYTDFSMAFGALVTGHAHPRLAEALRQRMEDGTILGFEGEDTAALCEHLCERFHVDRVKLSNTGLDATLFAIRFARHFTRRPGVLKFEGCYHGSHDALLASVKPTRAKAGDRKKPNVVPASTGLIPEAHAHTYVAPFNDLAATEAVAKAHAEDVAAVILEPIPMNMGFVLPKAGFLEGLRKLCDRIGALLIFDEVKTSGKFYGGAEEAFGVRPDMKVLGKAIGGGFPIAAVSGRADILDAVEPGVVSHAGTFNANPFSVAAARTTLEEILTRPAMEGAARMGERLGRGYRDVVSDRKVEGHVQYRGISGTLGLGPAPVVDWRSFLDLDVGRWWGYYTAMMNRGIVPMATGPDEQWTLSVQHTAEDVDAHLATFDEVARLLPTLRADVHLVESV
jgi:glutamate-1-semialdehyde 2,1-aminomutase